MKGIIAMKDDDQRFVVQAVHMLLEGGSRATHNADRTPENSYCVASDPNRTPRDVRLGSEMRSRSGTKPSSHSKRASCTTAFSKTCLPRYCRRRDKAELLQHHQPVKHQIERGMLTVAKAEHLDIVHFDDVPRS
jgi:hypothetical protein